MKEVINTNEAPASIGVYSQAIKIGNVIYLSGQIPLNPATSELVSNEIQAQVDQVFKNLTAVAEAAGGNLDSIVRISVYLTDLSNFPVVNDTMKRYFKQPYPARTTIGVAALPKNSLVEVDAIMVV